MEKSGASATPLLHPPPPPPPPPPTSEPYYGIPAPFYDPSPPTYILLPAFPRRRRRPCRCCSSLLSSSCILSLAFVSALLAGSFFFLWPSDPEISIARLRLNRIHVSPQPIVRLDVSVGLEIKVRNRDFFSLDYDSVIASIGYRGRRLGSVTSKGGHVMARGVSYVDAELHLNGIRVLDDVFYLIEDLARGSIPLDTVTEIEGLLHLFSLDVPIQGRISCQVRVNPENQTIIRQGCYPE